MHVSGVASSPAQHCALQRETKPCSCATKAVDKRLFAQENALKDHNYLLTVVIYGAAECIHCKKHSSMSGSRLSGVGKPGMCHGSRARSHHKAAERSLQAVYKRMCTICAGWPSFTHPKRPNLPNNGHTANTIIMAQSCGFVAGAQASGFELR